MEIQKHIQKIFEKNLEIDSNTESIINNVIEDLNQGKIRVCEKSGNIWKVNEWIKQSILLYFRIRKISKIESGKFVFLDKIPLRVWSGKEGVRVVPQALVRTGSYVGKNTVLMPSYINIGAYVDKGSLIDTWATVGSCAQVGKNVHVSGGVGLGGVLEPVQAKPVIIEDNVFLGSRSIIVEGVIVRENAVIGAGVILTSSTKIIDVTKKESITYRGEVPKNSVVIFGTKEKEFPAGKFSTPCALIIGKRSEKTNKKISLNECLRDFNIPA